MDAGSTPTYLCCSTCGYVKQEALKKHYCEKVGEKMKTGTISSFCTSRHIIREALQNHWCVSICKLCVWWAYFWKGYHNSQKYAHTPI